MRASQVLSLVEQRLRLVLNKPTGSYIRITTPPDERPLHRAEEGITISLSGPQTDSSSGAGRYGMKTVRQLIVQVASVCNKDVSGEDRYACVSHYDLEETVIDAIMDRHPQVEDVPALIPLGITCNHTGGTDAARAMGKDVGRIESTLNFTITYPATLSVR